MSHCNRFKKNEQVYNYHAKYLNRDILIIHTLYQSSHNVCVCTFYEYIDRSSVLIIVFVCYRGIILKISTNVDRIIYFHLHDTII